MTQTTAASRFSPLAEEVGTGPLGGLTAKELGPGATLHAETGVQRLNSERNLSNSRCDWWPALFIDLFFDEKGARS